MLNEMKADILALFPILGGKNSVFSLIKYNVSSQFFVAAFCQVRNPNSLSVLIVDKRWILANAFSVSVVISMCYVFKSLIC